MFKIRKFDGQEVWRRRHYRVRRDTLPGAFKFSVLDNGVVSNENWCGCKCMCCRMPSPAVIGRSLQQASTQRMVLDRTHFATARLASLQLHACRRIVACDDHLAWALFYYAGAAAAAGQTYVGAILATADGLWPAAVCVSLRSSRSARVLGRASPEV